MVFLNHTLIVKHRDRKSLDALRLFAEAELLRPPGNDEVILRWNRCVRLIRSRPELEWSTQDAR
jgi:hypothetical protein